MTEEEKNKITRLTDALQTVAQGHVEIGGQAPHDGLAVCANAARQDSHLCSVKELNWLPNQRAKQLRPDQDTAHKRYSAVGSSSQCVLLTGKYTPSEKANTSL